jgi:hypothetical protein
VKASSASSSSMGPAEQVAGDGRIYYVWPAAFAYDNWDPLSTSRSSEPSTPSKSWR